MLPGLTPAGARHVLRLYLTLVYASSGIEKLTGEAWRNGHAIWDFLMRPEVTIANFGWLSAVPWLAVMCGWSVLAIEIGYGTSVFFERLRKPLFIATLLMHLGIAVTFHLWAFSLTMIALNCGALPSELRAYFPEAEILPTLTLPWQTGAPVKPVNIGIAQAHHKR